MTLVVGELHDGQISLVADTKITTHDDVQNRHVFENALPKLLILREDLCMGLAGNDPAGVITALVAQRDQPVDEIVGLAASMDHASFVIAHLSDRPSLRQVNAGQIEDRTSVGRAWVGDQAGYEIFQAGYSEWPAGTEPELRLLASVQRLVDWNCVPSIGGFHTRVGTTREGLRFAADATHIGPEELHGIATLMAGDRMTLQLRTPDGGDQTLLALQCAVGERPTFGALAYLVAPLGLGILFRHASPAEPIKLRAKAMAELTERARTEHGQRLVSMV